MKRKFSEGFLCAKEKDCKVFWSSSLLPSSQLSIDEKNSNSGFLEKRKGIFNSVQSNSRKCLAGTGEDACNKLAISIKRLKTKEYSLPIARKSFLYTTAKTKVFRMGLKNNGEGFLVHKYFMPRRVLPNPKPISLNHTSINKSDQSIEISSLISKKIIRKSKLPHPKNHFNRNIFE